jgi:hypothetical protein
LRGGWLRTIAVRGLLIGGKSLSKALKHAIANCRDKKRPKCIFVPLRWVFSVTPTFDCFYKSTGQDRGPDGWKSGYSRRA